MKWAIEQDAVDWQELANLYRAASLGDRKSDELQLVFSNSRLKCFVYDHERLAGAGRALADGADCAYVCDVAVHPDFRGRGLGSAIIGRLKELAAGHRKILLYAKPGAESFYGKLGFKRMRTAMAIFHNEEQAAASGLIDDSPQQAR